MNGGVTLFIAIAIMSILLFVSFAVVNISIKSSLFASSGRDSQLAYFAADSGIECDLYWDSKNTPSAFASGAMANWAEVHVVEFSGLDRTSPLDQSSVATASTNSNPILISSGSKTTSSNNEMIFGYTDQWFYNGTVNAGSGFTKIAGDFSDGVEFKNVNSAGTYDASFSMTNPSRISGSWGALMTTFKAAAGETPALIQHKADNGSLGQNITFNSPSGNGNLIVVSFQYDTFDFIIDSMTDNKGNVYQRAAGPLTYLDGSLPRSQEIWYAKNIVGGGAPIKITANSPAFVPVSIDCNGQHFNAGLGTTNDVSSIGSSGPQPHRIGGGGSANPTSIFQLNFSDNTCAIEQITKNADGTTHIESRGYNTCDSSNLRRVERGVEVTY